MARSGLQQHVGDEMMPVSTPHASLLAKAVTLVPADALLAGDAPPTGANQREVTLVIESALAARAALLRTASRPRRRAAGDRGRRLRPQAALGTVPSPTPSS